MPTQRTKQINFSDAEQEVIKLAARGMYICNLNHELASQNGSYGAFHSALQRVMWAACSYDPDFMEGWDSNRLQCSLDLSAYDSYPQQIQYLCKDLLNVDITLE